MYEPSGSIKEVEVSDIEYEPKTQIEETEMEEKQVGFTFTAKEFQWALPSHGTSPR